MTKQKVNNGQMTVKEKAGYGLTDMAGNLLYVTFSSYILQYFTNILGLPAGLGWSASTILLVSHFINAILAIVWGSIIDHTRTKWGQSRPWFLFLALPFAVFTIMAFYLPSLGGTNTITVFWIAMVTFILASGAIYGGISAALSAVLPNLTNDPMSIVQAGSWRMVGGSVGSFITCMVTPYAVTALAKAMGATGDDPMWTKEAMNAWLIIVAIWAVVAGVLLLLAFLFMREHNYNPKAQPLSFKTSCKSVKGNAPWGILVAGFIVLWIAQSTRNCTATFYAQQILQDSTLAGPINGVQVVGILTAAVTPFIVKALKKKLKFPKTLLLLIGLGIAAIGQAGMIIKDGIGSTGGSLTVFFIFWIIGCLGAQFSMGLFFTMIADTVDFGEWKTGVRAPGLLASVGGSVSIQLGSAFGQFVPGLIMDAWGHSDESVKFVFIWLPIIVYAIVAAVMFFYIRFEKQEEQILADLAKRKTNPHIVNLAK